MTETLSCDLGTEPPPRLIETEFEKRRGVSRVEVRPGYAQVHVTNLPGEVTFARLGVLKAVADAGVSLDFLKLTPSGLSFLVPSSHAERIEGCLAAAGGDYLLRRDRAIVLVHAVNIRDEEGLIALIVREAVAGGTPVDHVGDMHDRLLMVVPVGEAHGLKRRIETRLREEAVLAG